MSVTRKALMAIQAGWALLSLSGCSGSGKQVVDGLLNIEAPAPCPANASLEFGPVIIGVRAERQFALSNSGTVEASYSFSAPTNSAFAVDPASLTLPPGRQGTVAVHFTPINADPQVTFSQVQRGDCGGVRLTLSGRGVGSDVSFSSPVDFGQVRLDHSKTLKIGIHSQVDRVVVSNIGVSGKYFQLLSPNDAGAEMVTITPEQPLLVPVQFAPQTSGYFEGTLQFETDVTGRRHQILLRGIEGGPHALWAETTVDFPVTAFFANGNWGDLRYAHVVNDVVPNPKSDGGTALNITKVSVVASSGNADELKATLVGSESHIQPGNGARIALEANPHSLGPKDFRVLIESNDGDAGVYELRVTFESKLFPPCVVGLEPTTLTFQHLDAGAISEQSIRIVNPSLFSDCLVSALEVDPGAPLNAFEFAGPTPDHFLLDAGTYWDVPIRATGPSNQFDATEGALRFRISFPGASTVSGKIVLPAQ
ncbi:MAG: choice-of-anchor D domain-containing protein [Myxococcaceae bacterium]|nr:choice-of-anchor D domain-containing protein [Myxococcaceae bacterium]